MDGSFGELLRGHRVSVGLTQEALAERAALSGQAVGALERGDRRFPRQDTVTRLADALALNGEPRAAFVAAASRRGRPRASAPAADRDESWGRGWHRALPGDVADFTGRTGELETCKRWVSMPASQAPVIVVINGMAGCGKSALAVHVAHRFADRFPDGQFFIDLHGHTPGHEPVPAQVAVADLLRCLDIPGVEVPAGLEQRSALWRSELADRRTVIVLDNALDAGQVRPLLPGSPRHLVLVTSRDRLADLDGALDLPLEPMPAPDATELFVRVAQRPAADQQQDIKDVVELCGGLPLAIRLAATRLRHHRSWTVAGLADRLHDRQRRLGELSAGTRSVAGAFELSYHQLTTRQRSVFRLLGLHPGPDIDVYVTAALCEIGIDPARQSLEQLADHHLLREHATDRYTFHDLLRAYASAIASEQEPPASRLSAVTRLVDYYLCAAAQANQVADPVHWQFTTNIDSPPLDVPSFVDVDQALKWQETERPNLVAAIHAAAAAGRDVQAWQLAQALVPFFSQMGYAQDRHDTQCIALRSARRVGNRVAEANILVDLASASHRLGRRDKAHAHYNDATRLAREIGNVHAQARAVARWGILYQSEGHYAQAECLLRNALTLFRDIGDRRQEAVTLAALAILLEHTGRYAESLRMFRDALGIMERVGPMVHQSRAHHGLGMLYARLGQYPEASEQLQCGLSHARTLRDREGEIRAHFGLGVVHSKQGHLDAALTSFRRALQLGDGGVRLGSLEAQVLSGLGAIQARLGNHTDAIALHERALSIARKYGARDVRATILNDLGETQANAGRHSDAAGCYREALTLAREIGLPHEEARASTGVAHVKTLHERAGEHPGDRAG